MDETALMTRREPYGPAIPAEVAVLTCGVDVQDDRLELELVGWGRDEESWSCDYRVLWGDPSNPTLWAELEQFLTATFEHETLAEGMHIDATCTEPDVPASTPAGTTRRPPMPFAGERNASASGPSRGLVDG